uniref:Uncharacterized protein n=1 Tax=Piliocolobus tephrosceles TaxID=591936 RepID=A0A8C9LLF9_9PRIM
MLLTHSSNFAISVSSSQGFTSSKMEDLATSAGFWAFFDSYYARRSSLSLFASSLSFSSSDPKRSISSSSSLLSVAPLPSWGAAERERTNCGRPALKRGKRVNLNFYRKL